MDKPADPATPFGEVYQSFLDDLAKEGTKPSTIHSYRYNIVRFVNWLNDNGHPPILASLDGVTPRRRHPTARRSRPTSTHCLSEPMCLAPTSSPATPSAAP